MQRRLSLLTAVLMLTAMLALATRAALAADDWPHGAARTATDIRPIRACSKNGPRAVQLAVEGHGTSAPATPA